ncbi:MAG TPA: penicillin-binding protein 1C [Bacteroidales bacterium]|nr:penicillin-binding protein 1C [Bacteroidales bacterium]
MNRKLKIILIATGVIIAPVLLSPMPRFRVPLSTVVEARDGSLLGARISDDGQWRFPPSDSVPYKFERALLAYEDNYFYYHPGVNPVALVRAAFQNIRAGRIISGGSTITMQVARLSRGNRERTYLGKISEILSAIKLEIFHSKKEILRIYAANAPFGGNTIGLDAATWRYSGNSQYNLSWAEAAAYAVLPNSPALVFPGKNQKRLKEKRDEVLLKLLTKKIIDSTTYTLSLDEPLPVEPRPLPSLAPHLTSKFFNEMKGRRIRTTIDPVMQERVSEIINSHQAILRNNFIFNSACIVVGVEKGEVLAYVGNYTGPGASEHDGDVDIIQSPRSTGSILKPLLYAAMQNSGDLLPNTLVPDIPTHFTGFSPKNFDQTWSGAVTASNALAQSLNIPAIKMLQKFTSQRFLDVLRRIGFTTFDKSPGHYGLSVILGGGEATLWELTGVYASLSRVEDRYNRTHRYDINDYHPPFLLTPPTKSLHDTLAADMPLSASSIWLTYEALKNVNRPESETGWQYFSSSGELAWKTGTSYGFRDGWAVGTTPGYVIGVWTGNADGEGRPGLTGTSCAAPVLFDVFSYIGNKGSFTMPREEMTVIKVCRESGYRAGPDCPETEEVWATLNGLRSEACPYHRTIHLNKARTLRVTDKCVKQEEIINEKWFVLPPSMEYYYRQKHPGYKVLPPTAPGCTDDKTIQVMEFIYPSPGVKIFIPRDQTGAMTRVVPEVAHRIPSKKVFWHLDDKYITTTRFIHQIELLAGPGPHLLTVVDEDGNTIRCPFTITNPTGREEGRRD